MDHLEGIQFGAEPGGVAAATVPQEPPVVRGVHREPAVRDDGPLQPGELDGGAGGYAGGPALQQKQQY